MEVEYRLIVGRDGYRVGTDGSVWTCWGKGPGAAMREVWREMKVRRDREGYRRVSCSYRNRRRRIYGNHMSKKPEGMEAFERLLGPLSQVPKKELAREVQKHKKRAKKKGERKKRA